MRLAKVKIGNIGQVITGKTPPTKSPELYGEVYPFITPTDISDDSCYAKPTRYISEEGRSAHRNTMLPPHTVCYTCIASIGKTCLTSETSLTNQQINSIIVDRNYYDYRFIYYLLKHETPRIKALASGVATPIINKSMFSEIELQVPSLSIQQKIATVLSAYDSLIDYNIHRIKILEEMAQAIYREWFGYFRFPGHEKVKMVDSPLGKIPNEWIATRLGEVADVQWGDTSTTKNSYVTEGYDAYSASGCDGKLDHYDYDKDGIVLSAIGANCGLTWLAKGKWSCIKNTIRIFQKDERTCIEYLYLVTMQPNYWTRRGAAQPFISQGDAQICPIIIPKRNVMSLFQGNVKPVFENICLLQKKNINLRQTRDLLLPKLISGQIDVSDLDIDIERAT